MAGKKSYAGIEIEFSANYNDLVKGLSEIDAMSNKLDKDLKTAQKALKFDPENTELAAAAQQTLAAAIVNTTNRLKMLESTEDEIKQKYADKIIPIEQYIKFQSELSKTRSSLDGYKQQLTELHIKENERIEELNRVKEAYQGVELEIVSSGQRISGLVDEMAKAQAELREYSKQASQMGSDDRQAILDYERNVEKMTARIEGYKEQITSLIGKDSGLKGSQDILIESTKELSNAQKEATSSATKMGEGYSTTKAIIADLASTVIKKTANSLIDFAKGSIEAASALYEVENVVDVAFEDMRGKVDEFAATSIETYGISELTAKRTAALFTSMGKAMDLTLDKASDLAIGLAQRSADMASFYDISQDITSTALKSVFTGETESLKRFGVVMTEANLQQYAFSQGIEKSIRDMTQAEKVQLRYNYLMQQTAAAGGDFARTSDSFANKTRQLKERLTETSIVIGNKFIQNLDGAFNTLDDLLKKVKEMGENGELDEIIKDISDILKNLLEVLTSVGTVLLKYPKLTVGAAAGFKAMQVVSKLNKPFETFANNVGRVAFNMSSATEQTGLLSSKLTMSAGAWAAVGTAAITAGLAIKDYIDKQREEIRAQNQLSEEQQKAIDEAAELTNSYQENAQAVKDNIAGIEASYEAYRQEAKELTELASKQDKTKADLEKMASLSESLESSMNGLSVGFDKTTGSIKLQGEELENLINSYEALAKAEAAKSALSDAYKEQAEAQAKVNATYKKMVDVTNQYNDALIRQKEAYRILDVYQKNTDFTIDEVKKAQLEYDIASAEVNGYSNSIAALNQEYVEYLTQVGIAEEKIEELNNLYAEASAGSDEAAKRAAEYTEELNEQAETLEDLSDSYKKAESSISSYKSAISELNELQKSIAEGTQMSTMQMLDLIEKYPELIGSIKETEKGYTLEKDSLEQLIAVRIQNLRLLAREKAETAESLYISKGGSKGYLESIKQLYDSGQIRDITEFQGKQYAEGLYDAIQAYSYEKGIDKLTTDIIASGFKEGEKVEAEAAEKTAKTVAKATEKATKQEAETLIEIYKHRYAQGIIDAETYYNKLDEIAKKYYANEGGYLERYMELEDEAQAGIKKAIEDKAKNYQNLKDKIEGVTEARKKLLGIESNKNVLAYQEATGFRLEANQSDIAAATKTLADAKTQLMQALTDISGDTNVYRALAEKLAAVTGEALENVLPELTTEGSVPTTKNYTFNFGDIISNGDGAALKELLNYFVNSVINETQII